MFLMAAILEGRSYLNNKLMQSLFLSLCLSVLIASPLHQRVRTLKTSV